MCSRFASYGRPPAGPEHCSQHRLAGQINLRLPKNGHTGIQRNTTLPLRGRDLNCTENPSLEKISIFLPAITKEEAGVETASRSGKPGDVHGDVIPAGVTGFPASRDALCCGCGRRPATLGHAGGGGGEWIRKLCRGCAAAAPLAGAGGGGGYLALAKRCVECRTHAVFGPGPGVRLHCARHRQAPPALMMREATREGGKEGGRDRRTERGRGGGERERERERESERVRGSATVRACPGIRSRLSRGETKQGK